MPFNPRGILAARRDRPGRFGAAPAAAPAPGHGGVAEWSKALVLKTSEPRGSVGSNPTPTANPLQSIRPAGGVAPPTPPFRLSGDGSRHDGPVRGC